MDKWLQIYSQKNYLTAVRFLVCQDIDAHLLIVGYEQEDCRKGLSYAGKVLVDCMLTACSALAFSLDQRHYSFTPTGRPRVVDGLIGHTATSKCTLPYNTGSAHQCHPLTCMLKDSHRVHG